MRLAFISPLLLAACAASEPPTAAAPEAPPPAAPVSENAEYSRSTETRGAVAMVDLASRVVVIDADDGRRYQVIAGKEVENLAALRPGDRIIHRRFEAVALASTQSDVVAATERDRTVSSDGVASLSTISSVLEFRSYDPAAATVSALTPDGKTIILPVAPEIRPFIEARQPGDMVDATMTVADAFEVEGS